MAGVASGGSMWKNVLIGIVTTVVAYSIVNYIKDRKEKKKEKEKIKTETVEAWKSLIRYEEQSTENYYAAFCNEDVATQLESMIYEKEQLAKNYELIGDRPGIDEDLASFSGRLVSNTQQVKKILEEYLNEIKKINPSAAGAQQVFNDIDSLYVIKLKMAQERDTASFNGALRSLITKHGKDFIEPEEEKMPDADIITGKWKEAGEDKIFQFNNDKTFTATAAGIDYTGKWTLTDKTLTLKFDDGSGSSKFNMLRCNNRYIRFTMDDNPAERQMCKN
jgi:hypothetical protein